MLLQTLTRPARRIRIPTTFSLHLRPLSTLSNNPHIYTFPHPLHPNQTLLSLLPTDPPTPSLAIGTTTTVPPTPNSFTENPSFLPILQSVFYVYAAQDPFVQSQAVTFASPGGFNLGGGGGGNSQGAGPASAQGGAGGANRGGHIHVSDSRNPPDWGRIAWPEDIFGSLEVDGSGRVVGGYQESGTYRIITREGILGIPPFLRERLVKRLRELEEGMKQK